MSAMGTEWRPGEWRADTGTFALIKRVVKTLWVARRIHVSVKRLEKELEEESNSDDNDRDTRWEELHRKNAKRAFRHIMKYKGFLAKIGQGISAKDGGVPMPYREEMKALQDNLPVSRKEEVEQAIKSELGASLDDLFDEFDFKPLASASVGQAHRAILKSTGYTVCVKVQHKGVEQMMNVDLRCAEFIAKKAVKLHKEAPDVTPIIREWRRASKDEVDFSCEARMAKKAAECLKSRGAILSSPSPMIELCSRRVLTMEFIKGWKVTDMDRYPAGSNLQQVATDIIEGFATLVFEEGIVHGDPHPGNIFVEQMPDGGLRPVLLDWGINKELNNDERLQAARWVIATLSQDRTMFMTVGRALGYKLSEDFETDSLEDWLAGSLFMFRDTVPSTAEAFLYSLLGKYEDEARKKQEEEKRKRAEEERGRTRDSKDANKGFLCGGPRQKTKKKENKKSVEQIPGVLLFLMRAMGLLQGLCSTLQVTINFAGPFLRHARALAADAAASDLVRKPIAIPGATLQNAILAKLEAFAESQAIVGAQVVVIKDSENENAPDSWSCNLAYGHADWSTAPVRDDTLMPLLEVSRLVLVVCLFSALSRPSSTGARIGIDTPLWQVWPQFGQHGTQSITIRQLLSQAAGMSRPFPRSKMDFKRFCNERRMEDIFVKSPQEPVHSEQACPILGVAVSALLKRITGHKTVAAAIDEILEPDGLNKDITYGGADSRMAWVVRRPMEMLSLPEVFEWLEKRQAKIECSQAQGYPEWVSWEELSIFSPACTDPLLLNHPDIRDGSCCTASRGLRASAASLCRFLRLGALGNGDEDNGACCTRPRLSGARGFLQEVTQRRRKLQICSLEEWEHLGRCLDIGTGLQVFRFSKRQPLSGQANSQENLYAGLSNEVTAYGYCDGATGSLCLKLPNATIAILLNGVQATGSDSRGPKPGFEILRVVADHFGLEPNWGFDAPDVPARTSMRITKKNENDDLKATLARLEEQLHQVTKGIENLRNGERSPSKTCSDLSSAGSTRVDSKYASYLGTWQCGAIEGIEDLLTLFEVPASLHFVAKQAKRTMSIEEVDDKINMATATSMAGRIVEETAITFEIGRPFQGEQQLGGAFEGKASWINDGSSEDGALLLEKKFVLDGLVIVLEEMFSINADRSLQVIASCNGIDNPGCTGGPLKCMMTFHSQDPRPQRIRRGVSTSTIRKDVQGQYPRQGFSRSLPRKLADYLRMACFLVPCGSPVCCVTVRNTRKSASQSQLFGTAAE